MNIIINPYAISAFLLIAGVSFANSQTNLTLSKIREPLSEVGAHRFTYLFMKVYDARLYSDAPKNTTARDILSGRHTLHLEFDYLRTIKKSVVLKSSAKILPKNMSEEEFASIENRVQKINEAYRRVGKGDSSALTYQPGVGTTLWINNERIITIEGEDFAQLYFRIWLGEFPISIEMRDNLLGQK